MKPLALLLLILVSFACGYFAARLQDRRQQPVIIRISVLNDGQEKEFKSLTMADFAAGVRP